MVRICGIYVRVMLPVALGICSQYGSVLIFDEVMSGFRVGLGGAQALYNIKPDLTAFTADLSSRLALAETSFKPWCAARQTMAATQALREIIETGVSPDMVTAVEVAVQPTFLRMVDHGVSDTDRLSRLTSVWAGAAMARSMSVSTGVGLRVPSGPR